MTPGGLARFTRPPAGRADAKAPGRTDADADAATVATGTAQADDLDLPPVLARFVGARPRPTPGESCEMCAVAVDDEHRHVVDLERRSLLCVCRGCALLFERSSTMDPAVGSHTDPPAGTTPGSTARYRTVPDRYVEVAPFTLPGPAWAALQIPVGIAFVVANTQLGRTVAFYPGPGGATESELPLDAWSDIVDTNPALAGVEADVEAVLLRTGDGVAGPGPTTPGGPADARPPPAPGPSGAAAGQDGPRPTLSSTCHIVPVDRCYELVGAMRLHWRGFDGGSEVRDEIAAFFDDVARRCARGGRTATDRTPDHAPRSSGGPPLRLADHAHPERGDLPAPRGGAQG